MYHPTSRALTVLELLQSRPSISGPELAARLEMDVRTVRRYITILQDIGIPIDATLGRHGGYRLRSGFKLPPLMLTEEEALAIVLGLLSTARLELDHPAATIAGALSKIIRVLPHTSRERLTTMAAHLTLAPHDYDVRPDAALLLTLSDAIAQQQRLDLTYRSAQGTRTTRSVDPYGLVGWWGRWYLVGYCGLRQSYRTFRLDRIVQVQTRTDTFVRADGVDCQAYVRDHVGKLSGRWQLVVEFESTLEIMQQKVSAGYGTLTTTATGVLFEGQHGDLATTAQYLMSLGVPFVIHHPPELRVELQHRAEQMLRYAMPPACPPTIRTSPPHGDEGSGDS